MENANKWRSAGGCYGCENKARRAVYVHGTVAEAWVVRRREIVVRAARRMMRRLEEHAARSVAPKHGRQPYSLSRVGCIVRSVREMMMVLDGAWRVGFGPNSRLGDGRRKTMFGEVRRITQATPQVDISAGDLRRTVPCLGEQEHPSTAGSWRGCG